MLSEKSIDLVDEKSIFQQFKNSITHLYMPNLKFHYSTPGYFFHPLRENRRQPLSI